MFFLGSDPPPQGCLLRPAVQKIKTAKNIKKICQFCKKPDFYYSLFILYLLSFLSLLFIMILFSGGRRVRGMPPNFKKRPRLEAPGPPTAEHCDEGPDQGLGGGAPKVQGGVLRQYYAPPAAPVGAQEGPLNEFRLKG